MKIHAFIVILVLFSTMNSFCQDSSTHFSKNNFTIKPFNANSIGIGMGVQYERYLDKTNNLSLVIPLNYSIELNQFSNEFNHFGIDVNPGVRFYFVEPRAFNWYLGTSVLLGMGRVSGVVNNWNGDPIEFTSKLFDVCSYVNVGFKGTLEEKFTYNLELGMGMGTRYFNKIVTEPKNIDYLYTGSNTTKLVGQVLVGLGYNF